MSELKNCPVCNNDYLAIRTDIYKDKREFVYCDCCGAMATRSLWQMINNMAEVESKKSPIAALDRCAEHDHAKPCSRCWEAEQEKNKVFSPFHFKPCVCFSDTQRSYCIDKNKCSKIVAQDQKR